MTVLDGLLLNVEADILASFGFCRIPDLLLSLFSKCWCFLTLIAFGR